MDNPFPAITVIFKGHFDGQMAKAHFHSISAACSYVQVYDFSTYWIFDRSGAVILHVEDNEIKEIQPDKLTDKMKQLLEV